VEIACLGSRTLQPHRQLLADGERIALGKRALEVISRLAEARGEIVTKDELLDAVWPGTTVEENALQAQVTALRKALGPDAGRLRTIRGIGYRLELDPEPARDEPQGAALSASEAPRWWQGSRTRGLTALSVVAAGAAVAAMTMQSGGAADTIQVEATAATGGTQARLLARNLDGQILNVLTQSGIPTRSGERTFRFAQWTEPERRLRGTVLQDGSRLAIDMRLEDVPSGTLLWSRRFVGESAERLATEASVGAARTLYAIGELQPDKAGQAVPEVVALYVRGTEGLRNALLREDTPSRIYQQIVSRAPQLAQGHALLAVSLARESRGGTDVQTDSMAQARREAARAIELDPAGAGAAFDANYMMSRTEHPRQFAEAERWLVRGLQSAPTFAYLSMRECRFLTEVGRARDALAYCQRALAQHPYSEPIGHSYARALWAARDAAGAHRAIDRAAALAPDHAVTRSVRFELAAFSGKAAEARTLLRDPATRPIDVQGDGAVVFELYLRQYGHWSSGERISLASELRKLVHSGDLPLDLAVMALASIGKQDDAFDLLRAPEIDQILLIKGSAFLFQPVTRALRADPRFWTAAADLGLAQYWKSSGNWPDMCGQELSLKTCQSQVDRSLAARAGTQ
jgi:DNA-binding winged helix-turn-helix (wHTH) protein/tetratricopeptide (TPR) repeat protein